MKETVMTDADKIVSAVLALVSYQRSTLKRLAEGHPDCTADWITNSYLAATEDDEEHQAKVDSARWALTAMKKLDPAATEDMLYRLVEAEWKRDPWVKLGRIGPSGRSSNSPRSDDPTAVKALTSLVQRIMQQH